MALISPFLIKRASALILVAAIMGGGLSACRKAEPAKPADPSVAAVPQAEEKTEKPAEKDPIGLPITFTFVPEIYKSGKAFAVGKRAQIMLKFNMRPQPDWIVMLATDGSYQIAFLQFDEKFKPMVDTMKPGTPYLVDFEVTDVTSGGAPRGKILAINSRTDFPPPENPLQEVVDNVKAIENLPPEEKARRRQLMRETLHKQVDAIEPVLEERQKELEKQPKK